jgi:DNA-binding MarR family transcriptional regulator
MHRVFFSVKRVHLRVVEESKVLLRRFGITPARFDLLRVVDAHEPHAVEQSMICRLLGVSATTVSRMLIALEKLGFIERTHVEGDRRRLLVRLSDDGWNRLDEAIVACLCSFKADLMAWQGVGGERTLAVKRLRLLQKHLNAMRRAYRDGAPFVDPWRVEVVPYHYTTIVKGRICYTADLEKPRVQYDDDDRQPRRRRTTTWAATAA